LLAAAGCGESESSSEPPQLGEPRIEAHKGSPPQRLIVRDLEQGRGRPAALGDVMTIQFAGAPYGSDEARWSSWGNLEPFTFHLGGYDILPGWEAGLRGMKVGGRRELIIPPRLATGEEARVYVIDLIAIQRTSPPRVFGASDGLQESDKPEAKAPGGQPPKHVVVKELRTGSGARVEVPADVVVKSLGVRYGDALAFFNAWGPDPPTRLALEDPHSIWATSLEGMRVGGIRKLIVPSRLAYGGDALIYVVELLSVE